MEKESQRRTIRSRRLPVSMKSVVRRTVVLAVLFAAGCRSERFGQPDLRFGPAPLQNMSVSTLRALCVEAPVRIEGSGAVVSGYVTTSDRSNNFYRSFFVEDGTGALEVRAGLYDMHNLLRVGQRVSLRLDGLAAAVSDGLLRVGLPGTGGDPVGYMGSPVVVGKHVARDDETVEPAPLPVTVPRLSESRVGMLVRIGGLCSAAAGDTTWAVAARLSADGVPRTAALKFRTAAGDSVYVVTSGYASFADDTVPGEALTVTGILLRGKIGGKMVYQLKMRDLNDVRK